VILRRGRGRALLADASATPDRAEQEANRPEVSISNVTPHAWPIGLRRRGHNARLDALAGPGE
jgi:hypothetical protein